MIRRLTPAVLFVLALTIPATPALAQHTTRVVVLSGITDSGTATDLWLVMLRRRLEAAEYDSAARIVHQLTSAERAWRDTVTSHARGWSAMVPGLVAPFAPLPAPDSVRVVVGNRGSEDAFSHDSLTVGLDLSALVRVYGAADSGDNPQKLDRFFRHEFTHTLQKRWLARHPFTGRTPLDGALLDIWLEGLGNYYSLGVKWQPVDGKPSAAATETLARLEPVLVDRLSALACADSNAAKPLLKGLSSGPFDRKWGAVTAALWLDQEMVADSGTLHRFVSAGPTGIWEFIERHLGTERAASVMRARKTAGHCS